MNVRSFPNPGSRAPDAQDAAIDIDHLLTLTNSRLYQLTGDPDVIATRLGLRHLKRLGLRALVYGSPMAPGERGGSSCANDESGSGG